MNNIKCQYPCKDSNKYFICQTDNWMYCNILNQKGVRYSDGTPVFEMSEGLLKKLREDGL
jgi:hypothetical protein